MRTPGGAEAGGAVDGVATAGTLVEQVEQAADVERFLDDYARGAFANPVKPRGLVVGGQLSPLIERDDYRFVASVLVAADHAGGLSHGTKRTGRSWRRHRSMSGRGCASFSATACPRAPLARPRSSASASSLQPSSGIQTSTRSSI